MNHSNFSLLAPITGLIATLASGVPDQASAASSNLTRWVTNNGVDSPYCGSITAPCRSISEAIHIAEDGDTILVGPGRYGDLNGNGIRDPGDEATGELFDCIVCVNKSLRIFSRYGAAVTTLDASGTPKHSNVVVISASDVTFGAAGSGFTVIGATSTGILVGAQQGSPLLQHVKVAGNVAMNIQQDGFSIQRTAGSFALTDNTAIGNGSDGFSVFNAEGGSSGGTIRGNVATQNGRGFGVGGFNIEITHNVATNNTQGMGLTGAGFVLTDNVVTSSGREGIIADTFLAPPSPRATLVSFLRNTVTGNRGPGLSLYPGATVTTLRSNNLFGNGTLPPEQFPPNCGLVNASGNRILAANNFWGAASGPGADPADEVCEQSFGSVTVVTPVAINTFPVTQ